MMYKVGIKSKPKRTSDLAKGELQPSVFQAGLKPEHETSMFWSRLITVWQDHKPKITSSS